MNVFHKVTLQSLKKNRTRTIVTVIGIILSSAMICAVTTFGSSALNYAMEEYIYSTGNWYGRALGQDYEVYESIRDNSAAEGVVCLQQLGYAAAEGCENEFKPYIYLLGAGSGVDEVLPIHMTSGTYPASPNEILLPDHLFTNGGVRYQIGDKLTLSLGQRVLNGDVLTQATPCYVSTNFRTVFNGESLKIRETRTYTVVGFYKRLGWRLEESSAPGYTAFTLADQGFPADYAYDIYFRTKKPGRIYAFMSENHLGSMTNRDLLMFTGTFRFGRITSMFYGLSAIVIGLIMFGSVALIYNAFSISVSERTRQFGLLSSIGATKRQLRRMVLFEASAVSLIGIPFGILSGIGGIGITLLLIGDKFNGLFGGDIDMKLSVSLPSVLGAAVLAFVTVLISAWIPSKRATKVSAVEAIRQNTDIYEKQKTDRTRKLSYALFGLPGVLAGKYYRRSKKKYRATILSLFMSIVLFVSASAFTEYLTEIVSGGLDTTDFDLYYHADADDFEEVTPDELLSRIKTAKAVTGAAYARERYSSNLKVSPEYLTEEGIATLNENQSQNQDGGALNFSACITFADDETFRAILKENGLSEEEFMDPEHPLALVLDGQSRFNSRTGKFETTTFFKQSAFEIELRENKSIPGYTLYNVKTEENGDKTNVYIKEGTEYKDGQLLLLSQEEASDKSTLNVGKTITKKPDLIQDQYNIILIYPVSASDPSLQHLMADTEYAFLIQSDDHTESYNAVTEVLRDSGIRSGIPFDYAAQEESDRNLVTVIRVFSYGFIVLISLIAAANVFNTISTNINLRRREFAMLKSVGMTGRGFNRMMNYECLLYGSRALLYGLPVSCGVTWLIYRAVMSGYETTFRLPFSAIGIAVLSVFLVVFITMMYAMDRVKKDNPIDALKNENL